MIIISDIMQASILTRCNDMNLMSSQFGKNHICNMLINKVTINVIFTIENVPVKSPSEVCHFFNSETSQ